VSSKYGKRENRARQSNLYVFEEEHPTIHQNRGGVNAIVLLNANSPISRPTWDFETDCISPSVRVCYGFRCKKSSEVVVRVREAKRGGRLGGNVPKHRTTK
jgi:hypothetical protein